MLFGPPAVARPGGQGNQIIPRSLSRQVIWCEAAKAQRAKKMRAKGPRAVLRSGPD